MSYFSSQELLEKGKECFQRNEFKRAESILSELVDSRKDDEPTLVESYFLLANIYHTKGELGKAIKAFTKVLSLDPSHTDASISLSVLYNDIGQYEKAKAIFKQADERVKSKNNGPEVRDNHINKKFALKHLELADLYFTYGRFDEALFEYNKVIALNPENLEVRLKIAKTYAKKGFVSKAIDELRKLKNEYPDYHQARVALGIIYYGNGNIIEAQTEWQKVLSKDPRNSEAAMYLNLSRTANETSLSSLH